jgi:hypothetical protein
MAGRGRPGGAGAPPGQFRSERGVLRQIDDARKIGSAGSAGIYLAEGRVQRPA